MAWKRWLVFGGGILVFLVIASISTGCFYEENAGGSPRDKITFENETKEIVSYGDMRFVELKEKALVVTYKRLYDNFDRYSLESWKERGGPIDSIPPILYFQGELIQATDTEFVIWKGLFELNDGNAIVLNVTKIVDTLYPVGTHLEALVICQKMVEVKNELLPQCLPHQLREMR